jgi:predicted enzyme related to lactoylglutathione lyase
VTWSARSRSTATCSGCRRASSARASSFWSPEADGEAFEANTAGIGLRVADVEAAVEEFRAAGGEVIGIEDSGVCHMGFVKDPDGNVLILHHRYAPKEKRGQG